MANTYRGTKEYFLIYCELITAARQCSTVTYQDLAALVGLPPQGNWMGKALGQYLGEISQDEVTMYGRPMLSAVAVTVTGKAGNGFFALAKELGKLTSDDSTLQYNFWQAEKAAAYDTWRGQSDTASSGFSSAPQNPSNR